MWDYRSEKWELRSEMWDCRSEKSDLGKLTSHFSFGIWEMGSGMETRTLIFKNLPSAYGHGPRLKFFFVAKYEELRWSFKCERHNSGWGESREAAITEWRILLPAPNFPHRARVCRTDTGKSGKSKLILRSATRFVAVHLSTVETAYKVTGYTVKSLIKYIN